MTSIAPIQFLAAALKRAKTEEDTILFLQDLCTPQELEDLCVRWQIVSELKQGYTYREIHARTKASLTTIGRIANALNYGSGGYQKIYEAMQIRDTTHDEVHPK